MWINPEVDLPEAVLAAQRDSRLVVFAGAGVSMAPPSGLPNFEELANRVAGGALVRAPLEPLDRFLGRLEMAGVDVQGRTRAIVGAPTSKPTRLHEDLVRLFPGAHAVRLVTTNFDRHFNTVAKAIHGDGVEFYCGPALPLGRDVIGVVNIHGSVDKLRNRLVLSDEDFGRAYLTDGWATRMLAEMFARYCVLFVGYSHDDPIMGYLARSLVPGSERFILTALGNDERWKHYGIIPVEYPLRAAPDAHGALRDAIAAWADSARMGILDHEQRVRRIVSDPPPLEREPLAYIESVLRDPVMVRFFTASAKSVDWLRWAETQKAFDGLFGTNGPLDKVASEIALWFAGTYAVAAPTDAIALLQRRGKPMHPVLTFEIARAIAVSLDRVAAEVLTAWIAVLVGSDSPPVAASPLSQILSALSKPEHGTAGVLLFGHLATPRIELQHPWGVDTNRSVNMRGELVLRGDYHDIDSAWQKFFKPHLSELAGPLATVVVAKITEAAMLLRATGQGSEAWDLLSFSRQAIEPHAQDRYLEGMDLLVDAARDVLEWLLTNRRRQGEELRSLWLDSGIPLLRRIGIHGMVVDGHLNADAAIDEILARDWLFTLHGKHEVFRLLATAFPRASEQKRREVISRADEAATAPRLDGQDREIADYERYNLAVWLMRSAPEDAVALEYMKRMQAEFPDFAPREYPDLSHWSGEGGWVVPRSPRSVDELVAHPAAQQVDYLVGFEGGARHGDEPDREGLLAAVRDAASREFSWGWDLASAILARDGATSDLWDSLLTAWATSELEEKQVAMVVGLLHATPALDAPFGRQVAEVLMKLADSPVSAAPVVLTGIEEIGDRLRVVAAGEELVDFGRHDWLLVAINRLGGRVAQVWLKALSLRLRADVVGALGLPDAYKNRFSEVLAASDVGAQTARVVLASQVSFLYNAESEWVRASLMSQFDWSADPLRAEQAWHGFLGWGQWNDALFKEMLPFTAQAFSHLESELAEQKGPFVERLAAVAVYSALHPIESGWLSTFIQRATPAARTLWASGVQRLLGRLPDDAKRSMWSRWMESYWKTRLTGVPAPLDGHEGFEMIEWILDLEPVIQEVAELAGQTPLQPQPGHLIYYRLEKSDLARKHPNSISGVVHHLLRSSAELRWDCGHLEKVVTQLHQAGANTATLLKICDEMARVGCSSASQLRSLIEPRGD